MHVVQICHCQFICWLNWWGLDAMHSHWILHSLIGKHGNAGTETGTGTGTETGKHGNSLSDPARRCQRVWTTRVQSQGIYRVLERFVWAFICEHVHQGVEQGKGTHWRQICHGSCSRKCRSAMMVMSSSGQQPHYVWESKAGGYLCDDHCLSYKSSKICSQ